MATFLSVHDITKLAADTVWTADNDCSPHITLNFEGENFENRGAVTIYIADSVLIGRLIKAVNFIVKRRREELETLGECADA
jgi:hypothetical protein